MTPSAWPRPTATVMLRWALETVPARVMRHVDDDVVLAASVRAGRGLPERGGRVSVGWSDERGLHERAGTVVGTRGGMLHLTGDGLARTTQRRRFFRAPVTIDLTLSDGSRRYRGRTVDLSEGGALAEVEGRRLLPSTTVTAVLHADGERFEVPATVVRHVQHGQQTQVSVAFADLPDHAASMIRRHVFDAQVAARKNGVPS